MVVRVDFADEGVAGFRYVCQHEGYKDLCFACTRIADKLREGPQAPLKVMPSPAAISSLLDPRKR